MIKPVVISVVGPTALGKTKLAIALANALNTEIISSDSRQFYKEMCIGTAVPSAEELAQAKHHCIQHISIFDNYSVGDFEREGLALTETIFNKSNICILVGGSGLYSNALTKGLDKFPEVDSNIRSNLNQELKHKGIETLQKQLQELDPLHFNKIDTNNPHRLIRALEICIGSGQPYSSFLNKTENKRPFKTITLGLQADRPVIYDRINRRVDLMMAAGLLEEAKALHPHKSLNALQTVGYRELFRYFDGEIDLDFAISEIKKNTRRFAKRQLTWYRKDESVHWIDYQYNISDVVTLLKKELNLT